MEKKLEFIPVDYDPFADTASSYITIPTTGPQQEIFTNIIIGGYQANCAYNESVSLILTGPFRLEEFRQAVNLLVARHESLRCLFNKDGLTAHIQPDVSVEVLYIDLTGDSQKQQNEKLAELIRKEVTTEFDLYQGPLFKVTVVRLKPEVHQIVFTVHHIVCDGWSIGICLIDLSRLYSELCKGTIPQIPDAVSWRDYVSAETEYRRSHDYLKTVDFWRRQYADGIPAIELPINNPRPAMRSFPAKRLDMPLDENLVRQLRMLGNRHGCSFVNTLLAAFEIYLHRLLSVDDIVVQLPTAGQSITGMENLVGHGVNVIPVRTQIDSNSGFAAYLKARKKTLLEQLEHQRITIGDLVRELPTDRNPALVPFSPVAFNLDIGLTSGVHFHDLEFQFVTNPRAFENSEWFVNCAGQGDHILIEWTYNAVLFDEEMMHWRMQEFITLLKSIVNSPDTPVRYLEILPPDELNKIIVEWNDNFLPVPEDKTIHSLFEEQVQRTPRAPALWYQSMTMTYEELNQRANQLSHYLLKEGLRPGTLCAVCLDRTPELMVALLAILKCGAAYIPMTPDYPAARMLHILNESGCGMIITQPDQLQKIDTLSLKKIVPVQINEKLMSQPVADPCLKVDPSSTAYVIYTSGSTGVPKGVEIMHRNVVDFFQWAAALFSKEELAGVLGSISITFDPSVFEIFFTLTHGGRLVLVNHALELPYLPADAKVTLFSSVPSAAAELLKMENGFPHGILTIILGGELLTTELVKQLYEKTTATRVYDFYGPTEDTYTSCWTLRNKTDRPTIGRPIPNTQTYILDRNLQPVPIGVAGELHLAGEGLAKGYLNRSDLTRERFIPNPFSIEKDARLYKTGDLCRYLNDGRIEFLGRLDFQVKIRGFRIELMEIENVLKQHPAVENLHVTVWNDTEGEKQLVAYLTLRHSLENTSEELRKYLSHSLPEYMIPQFFIVLDRLPLNAHGKIDRKALPVPVVPPKEYAADELSLGQLSLTEEKLKDIWKMILGHDRFGIDDNFFTIGGHSLLGVRMFIELENQYGIRLPLQTLFRAPTIRELAREIDSSGTAGTWQPVVMFRKGHNKPPLFCLHMHNGNIYRWKVLEKYLPDDQPIYAIQPRALDPEQKPQRSVTEQATTYIEEIKKIQPHGPYYLAGLCYGGTVAFEMALQLQARGEKTALCLMVNNYAPLENPTLYRLTKGFERFFKMDFAEKIQYALEKNRRLGKKLRDKTLGKLFGKTSASQAEQSPQQDDIRVIHTLALMAYQPSGKYNGDVFIVRAGGEIEDPQFYDQTLGWKKWMNGKIEVVQIEGSNNDTIIEEEQYSSQLAEFIRRKLEELQSIHTTVQT